MNSYPLNLSMLRFLSNFSVAFYAVDQELQLLARWTVHSAASQSLAKNNNSDQNFTNKSIISKDRLKQLFLFYCISITECN